MVFVVENYIAVVEPDLHWVRGVSIALLFVLMQNVGTQITLVKSPVLLVGVESSDVAIYFSLCTTVRYSCYYILDTVR